MGKFKGITIRDIFASVTEAASNNIVSSQCGKWTNISHLDKEIHELNFQIVYAGLNYWKCSSEIEFVV